MRLSKRMYFRPLYLSIHASGSVPRPVDAGARGQVRNARLRLTLAVAHAARPAFSRYADSLRAVGEHQSHRQALRRRRKRRGFAHRRESGAVEVFDPLSRAICLWTRLPAPSMMKLIAPSAREEFPRKAAGECKCDNIIARISGNNPLGLSAGNGSWSGRAAQFDVRHRVGSGELRAGGPGGKRSADERRELVGLDVRAQRRLWFRRRFGGGLDCSLSAAFSESGSADSGGA